MISLLFLLVQWSFWSLQPVLVAGVSLVLGLQTPRRRCAPRQVQRESLGLGRTRERDVPVLLCFERPECLNFFAEVDLGTRRFTRSTTDENKEP